MSISLGRNGCIAIKMQFKDAPLHSADKLFGVLSSAARGPEGGTIHKFAYGTCVATFIVRGQCEFDAEALESAARAAGFDSAQCECSEHRLFNSAEDN